MNQRKKGILCIVLSALFFALMNVCVKASGPLPSMEKSFFRNLVALLTAGFLLLKSGEGFHIQKKSIPVLFCRSLFGTIGILGNFYAVDHMFLADASAIQKLVPFVTILASYFLLKEKIRPYQIFCIVLAFGASLLVVKPTFSLSELFPALAAAAGALCAGIAYTLVRMLSMQGVKKAQIIFYFSSFSCLAMVPFLFLEFTVPTFQQLMLLLLAGIFASCGQFAVTYAYSYAPAKEISVLDYSQILFAAVLGLFLFGQIPDLSSIAGYLLILAAGLLNYFLQLRTSHLEKARK